MSVLKPRPRSFFRDEVSPSISYSNCVPENLKQESIWGVITRSEAYHDPTKGKPRKVVMARIVANTTSFHPNAVLGNNLTYVEAEAIVKLHNSGVQHGTD